jgi:flavin-dependent dehydrogenase
VIAPADVAVIGAGPAGAAAAVMLARRGARVALLSGPPSARRRFVETLPPASRPLLRELGMWPLVEARHVPVYANESVWGSAALARTDFTCDPNGRGWLVDREVFDADWLALARQAGARIFESPISAVARNRHRWRIDRAGGAAPIAADWVVDATGRRGVMAAQFAVSRRRNDTLVAVVATVSTHSGLADPDRVTFVEATADGWWFTAVTTAGDRLVAYFTDAHEPSARVAATPGGFTAMWAATPQLAARVPLAQWVMTAPPQVRSAASSCLAAAGGEGWLAVGDALMTFDPISSQGLMTAAYTGLRAAEAIVSGPRRVATVAHYDDVIAGVYAAYLAQRAACYRTEQRWRQRPFWRTRHAAPLLRRSGPVSNHPDHAAAARARTLRLSKPTHTQAHAPLPLSQK